MTTLSLNRKFSTAVPGIFRTFAYMKEPRVYNGIERPEFTPERISELRPDEVFVFGSNLEGMHGVGLRGQSYAIPTMQGGVETIKPYTDEFVSFASAHPELFFYVTCIGCGIAGFKEKEIAPLFADAVGLENVCLPESFIKILNK